jgi:hypothetical protein
MCARDPIECPHALAFTHDLYYVCVVKTARTRLYEILKKILASSDIAKGQTVNHKNALNAVLFEAIDLVITLDEYVYHCLGVVLFRCGCSLGFVSVKTNFTSMHTFDMLIVIAQ